MTNFGASPDASVAKMSSIRVSAAICTGAWERPSRAGAQAHLLGRFLARNIDDPAAAMRQRSAGLDQQRRLADAGLAADERRRARHEAAAGDAVEFADAGDDPRDRRRMAAEVFEREGRPATRRRAAAAADSERRRLLDDGVPLAAGLAFALPALGDRAAVLADIGGPGFGHRVVAAHQPGAVERPEFRGRHIKCQIADPKEQRQAAIIAQLIWRPRNTEIPRKRSQRGQRPRLQWRA